MDKTTIRIIAVIATVLAGPAAHAQAQAVWRCGSSYQQAPCPGGQAVTVDDARSAQDRAAQLQNVERTARMADRMESDRVKAEAQATPLIVPPAPEPALEKEEPPAKAGYAARVPKAVKVKAPKKKKPPRRT